MSNIAKSAPGKIILFGEHAVVYGQPAIAVPVTQVQAKAIVRPDIKTKPGTIHIAAPQIDLNSPLADLPLDDALAQAVALTLEYLEIDKPPAFKLKISSTIPLAAGLGSGAAVSVAVIRAVGEFLGHVLDDETVNNMVYEVEKLHHGTPSGIDNTVVTYAQPVYFVRGQTIEIFSVPQSFTIVIGDTGVVSPTSITVGDVRSGWEAEPEKYDLLFDSIGELSQKARQAIELGETDVLGPLMDANHAHLVEMGVSSPELDNLVEAAWEAGALGAKLSGGGRGGNMIALVRPEDADRIAQALIDSGATNTIITRVS
ncbi:MAG: mevalonate kinase [Chloroflexi bacterium]|nr:MAG: mevalonate kinase [Chloroflexota bacterium]MBL1196580.1 mevalonate kinase [Chloroflexota bacterium]NOH13875.1 mevalonate kinase [Chloroflexota bacterium]